MGLLNNLKNSLLPIFLVFFANLAIIVCLIVTETLQTDSYNVSNAKRKLVRKEDSITCCINPKGL